MRFLIILLFISSGNFSFGQNNKLQYQKQFDQSLRLWTSTFNNFNLSDFKAYVTVHFDNNFEQDFNYYKEFLATYKPIIMYSLDNSKFIDIYSYQLNLEKKGNIYYANPDIDQTVFLCDTKTKYWNRIYFGTSSRWIDEVVWISNRKFILVGIEKSAEDKKMPIILLGDINNQTLISYLNNNKNCFQNDKNYTSTKLKKIKIKGL